ncbi:MAG: dihydrodipicolinate synthase family protein [Candidatus Marinimicrobia bacterium]|jgi:4-hydroxy-tetrahydrodipicolinate synthase|nr:dihydrodipicolinate synthase family protein [Candidatus Neomarinimicrobiota bacterium]|tara:strand:+ start:49001 stop:49915 length:915 start_codon:yes stop_codon:yes gene_type:complete
MNHLKGVWVPVLSPMEADLSLDRIRFFDHLQWLFDHGIDGVVLFGTNSEATSFSVVERIELLDWVLARNIPNEKVMVGTGCSALTDTTALSQHAVSLGYFNHLILPPFYYKNPTQEGLMDYFSAVIRNVNDDRLRIYLYNFPQLSGINIEPGLAAALNEEFPEQIAGYKDSSGNWENTMAVMEQCPGIIMFPSSEAFLLKILKAGGAGVISGTANVNPKRIKQTYEAYFSDRSNAEVFQAEIKTFRLAVQKYPLVGALKSLIIHYRKDGGWQYLRPPLTLLSSSDFDTLLNEVKSLKFTLADES